MLIQSDVRYLRALFCLFLLYLLWIVAGLIKIMPFQIDDAYITYRYVQNFLESGGFSFDPGGVPVEGFSSQLWFWLLVFLAKVSGIEDIALLGPLLGTGILCIASLTFWFTFQKKLGFVPVFLILIVILSLPSVSYYAVTGLEELLFAFLVLFVALHFSGFLHNKLLCFLLIIASVWARPEAPWLLVMLAIKVIYERDIKSSLGYAAMTVFSILTLYIYRYAVFGDIFPNTYYAKHPEWREGMKYIHSALTVHPWFSVLLVLAMLGGILGDKKNRLMFLFALSWLLAAIVEGGDWMPMLRFFLPAMLLMAFSLHGIVKACQPRTQAVVVLILGLAAAGNFSYYMSDIQKYSQRYYLSNRIMQTWAKTWFDTNGISRIATIDIGAMSYQRNYQVTDLVGLTDAEIAHMPGSYMSRIISADFLLQRGVEVILFRLASLPVQHATVTRAMFDNDTELKLFFDPVFLANYDLLMILPYPDDGVISSFYGYMIMVRKDLQLSPYPLQTKDYQGIRFADYTRPVLGQDKP